MSRLLKRLLRALAALLSPVPAPANPEPGASLPSPEKGNPATPPADAGAGADELDPREVIWDEPRAGDVGKWPITEHITRAAVDSARIYFSHTPLKWPTLMKVAWDKPARGNVWIIARCADGKWHGATIEWLADQQFIPQRKWDGTDAIHGPVGTDFRPTSGTVAYIMLSTFARAGVWTVAERSQIARVVWP